MSDIAAEAARKAHEWWLSPESAGCNLSVLEMAAQFALEAAYDEVTRVVVVDPHYGRIFDWRELYTNGAEVHVQDEGRTLKILPRREA